MYSLEDRICGSLLTAAIGDALGAPAEAFSRAEIKEKFGRIVKFESCEGHPISPDNFPGEVTDDTSQMMEMAKAVAASGGDFTVEHAAQALIDWANHYPKYYPRNAGPTTMHTIKSLMNGEDPRLVGKAGFVYGRGTSNGCIMRIAAAGLIHPGDPEGAIKTAVNMTIPSHYTQHGLSSACAIACAISEAVTEKSTVWSVLRSAVYGAKRGEEIGMKEARIACGTYTYPKILKAVELALAADSSEAAEDAMERFIDSGDISASGAAAVAIGLFAASNGDSMKTLISCVNAGGDTDTVACVAGMVAGAFNGCRSIPEDLLEVFTAANPTLDIRETAVKLATIASL